MVSTAREILEGVNWFRINKPKYWYGGKGEVASKKLAERLKAENPNTWTGPYYEKALKDIDGKTRVFDCSGMVCNVYGIGQIGSYQIEETFKEWTSKPMPGMIAWRPGHVGIIVSDDGRMAEMRSQAYDFKENRTWKSAAMTKILYSPEIDYHNVQTVGWHQEFDGFWLAYGHKKGEYYKNCLKNIDGVCYAFDECGYVVNGFVKIGEKFYLSTDCGVVTTDQDGEIKTEIPDHWKAEAIAIG